VPKRLTTTIAAHALNCQNLEAARMQTSLPFKETDMNSYSLRFAILMVVAFSSQIALSGPADEQRIYFVAPIKTEVHRAVISDEAHAYAVVNCSPLVREEKVDLTPLNEPQFKDDLKKLATGDRSQLKLVLRYKLGAEGTEVAQEAIQTQLTDIARTAGFQEVTSSAMFTSATWESVYEPVRDFKETQPDRERIVDDELIRAYPLRTKLSKMVVGNAEVVIEIKRPFDGRQQEISKPLRESIRRAVAAMDLPAQKGKLLFQLSSTAAGEDLIGKLFHFQQPIKIPADASPALRKVLTAEAAKQQRSEAFALALELGFDSIGYTHSPGGGAPEALLGRPAPSFELTTLDGQELELQKFIAGRPALVTFWGVACAPCCAEAPELTAVHKKYGQEFAIVAVNGYDESRELVAAFAQQAKLQHPIALNGGSVANEVYQVGSYPTTFWINREGAVEDYEIGTHSAASLERRIQNLLKKQ
jgi:thiol-disulfide isomerase/thioredoxin